MENFTDLNQSSGPERNASAIINHALEMFKGVFGYGILLMVIYLIASMLVQPISGFNSQEFSEEIMSSDGDYSALNLRNIPGLGVYYGLTGLLGILIAPLYVGFIYIVNKYNLKEAISFSDLFIGYKQNFVNIIIYALISSIILAISMLLCVIPVFFVFPLLLLGYPILLFENASFSEALSKSFNIAKENYGTFLGAGLLGILISISGVLLCGIGILVTFPFYLIVMYSIYCAYCGRPRPILLPK